MKRLLADLAVYYLLSEMWVPDKRQKIIKPVVEEKVQINWLFNYNLITQLTSRLRLYINSLVPNHAVYSRLLLEMWKLSKRHSWKQFLLRRKKEQEIYHELLENISEIYLREYRIGHFRVPKTLTFKMRLGAQPFLVKKSFICMRMKNDFHNKRWAATLVLKQRPGWTRKWPIASCKIFQDSLRLDSRYRIPDSLSLKLRFWISVLSRIPDSVSWIPDSKPQNSEFHCKKFQYFIGIRNSLHEENDTTILSKPQLLLHTNYSLCACCYLFCLSGWTRWESRGAGYFQSWRW